MLSDTSITTRISMQQYNALVQLASKNNVTVSLMLRGIIADALADEGIEFSKERNRRGPRLNSRIRAEIVTAIRGEATFREIAARYNTTEQTVSRLAYRFGLGRRDGQRRVRCESFSLPSLA